MEREGLHNIGNKSFRLIKSAGRGMASAQRGIVQGKIKSDLVENVALLILEETEALSRCAFATSIILRNTSTRATPNLTSPASSHLAVQGTSLSTQADVTLANSISQVLLDIRADLRTLTATRIGIRRLVREEEATMRRNLKTGLAAEEVILVQLKETVARVESLRNGNGAASQNRD